MGAMFRGFLLVIALFLFACNSDRPAFATAPLSDTLLVVSPSDGGASNDARPTLQWTRLIGAGSYRVSVYADAARAVVVAVHDVRAAGVRLNNVFAEGQEIYWEVTAYDFFGRFLAQTDLAAFRVVVPPASFPKLELRVNDADRAQGGYKLFNIFTIVPPPSGERPTGILLVNGAGEIVWSYLHGEDGFLSDSRVLPNGNLMFFVRVPVTETSIRSTAYEMTWDGTFVWQSRDGVNVHHEVAPGPGGNYLYLKFVYQDFMGESYEGDGLELVDPATNQVLWEWNIFDHYDPADWQVPEAARPGISRQGADWSHSNAAVWDPDRSLIWVSVRHFDQIIGIKYPEGTIDVVLGNQGLGGPGLLSHTHAPEVQADGSILFWNNGNGHSPPESSARIVTFDTVAKTAAVTFEWKDHPPFFDFAVGDADRLPNGNILVTAGVSGRIIEIDEFGDKVWELAFNSPDHWTYRTDQVPTPLVPSKLKFR